MKVETTFRLLFEFVLHIAEIHRQCVVLYIVGILLYMPMEIKWNIEN